MGMKVMLIKCKKNEKLLLNNTSKILGTWEGDIGEIIANYILDRLGINLRYINNEYKLQFYIIKDVIEKCEEIQTMYKSNNYNIDDIKIKTASSILNNMNNLEDESNYYTYHVLLSNIHVPIEEELLFLNEDTIRKDIQMGKEINWFSLSYKYSLSEKFMMDFKFKLIWDLLSINQVMSEDFIKEFIDFIVPEGLSLNKRIPNEIKNKYLK